MKRKRITNEEVAAFVMEAGDRFHAIIASDPIRYGQAPDTETVLVFFVIRRTSELIDIFNVMKTFKGKACINRNVQSKLGIPADRIADEIDSVRIGFAMGIEKATGYKLLWHELDLSDVEGHAEQVARIKAWGRVKAWTAADGAAWN